MSARGKKILELLKSSEQIVKNPRQSNLECNKLQKPGRIHYYFIVYKIMVFFILILLLLGSPNNLELLSLPQDNPGPSGYFNSSNILQKPGKFSCLIHIFILTVICCSVYLFSQ